MNSDLLIQRYDYATGESESACYRADGTLDEFKFETDHYLGYALWCDPVKPEHKSRRSRWCKPTMLCDAPAGSSELAAQLSIARATGKEPVFPRVCPSPLK